MGLPVEAVISLGGAIGVGHCSYPVKRAWLHGCQSYRLAMLQWRAAGVTVRCRGRAVVVVFHRHWGGRRAGHSAHALRHGSQSGADSGPGSSAVVRGRRGEPPKVDPLDGGDLLGPREGLYPVPCLARREGAGGARALPRRGWSGWPLGPALGPDGS